MDTQFLRCVSALVGLGSLFGASILPAAAQDGPKLYAFSSGRPDHRQGRPGERRVE